MLSFFYLVIIIIKTPKEEATQKKDYVPEGTPKVKKFVCTKRPRCQPLEDEKEEIKREKKRNKSTFIIF